MKSLAAIAAVPMRGLRDAVAMVADMAQPTPDPVEAPPFSFSYKNHKGVTSIRHVMPISIRFGTSEWHKTPTFLMRAYDYERRDAREFDMAAMGASDRVMMRETLKLAVDLLESIDRDEVGAHVAVRRGIPLIKTVLAQTE